MPAPEPGTGAGAVAPGGGKEEGSMAGMGVSLLTPVASLDWGVVSSRVGGGAVGSLTKVLSAVMPGCWTSVAICRGRGKGG